jgi:thiol-disulfide isomerase/thioredoxin
MRIFSRTSTVLLAVLAAFVLGAAPAPSPDDTVTMKTVKYPDLVRTVRELQGKVVVVDFWGNFCIPCKKEFPNLVEMHRKYNKDGFAAVSVDLDDPKDKEATDGALKFLRAKDAEFTNLQLDEPLEVWSDKFGSNLTPFIFVFDRDGRIAGKFEGKKANYQEQIEPLVIELLKK